SRTAVDLPSVGARPQRDEVRIFAADAEERPDPDDERDDVGSRRVAAGTGELADHGAAPCGVDRDAVHLDPGAAAGRREPEAPLAHEVRVEPREESAEPDETRRVENRRVAAEVEDAVAERTRDRDFARSVIHCQRTQPLIRRITERPRD